MIVKFKVEHISYEDLHKAYLDCRRRKRSTGNCLIFEMFDAENLYRLWLDLNANKYKIGKSIAFCLKNGNVQREVFAADFRDRIIHHLIINKFIEIFEDEFIEDSYSCRKGKGTSYAIKRLSEFIKLSTNNYKVQKIIVKCDLFSFFTSINKNLLWDSIRNIIEINYRNNDKDFLLNLVKLIIFNKPQHNCKLKHSLKHWEGLPKYKSLFHIDENFGLAVGNLTSQFFANLFLSILDHIIKDMLKIEYYGRYVDDFFFICNSVEEANKILNIIKDCLNKLGIKLHPRKLYIQKINKGVKFVGSVVKPNRIYISNLTKGKFWDKLKEYYDFIQTNSPSLDDIEYFVSSVNSYLGFMKHTNSFNLRKKMLLSEFMKPWMDFIYISNDFFKILQFKDFLKIQTSNFRYSKNEYYLSNLEDKLFL